MRKQRPGEAGAQRPSAVAAVVMLGLACAFAAGARAAPPPSPDEVLSLLGFTAEEREALRRGEIVARDQAILREDHISAAVAMHLAVPVEALHLDALTGRNLVRDPNIAAVGSLQNGAAAWQGQVFGAEEAAEARRLGEDRGGSDFNLSAAEAAAVETGLGAGSDSAAGPEARASALYREILLARQAAYRAEGLGAIAPYRRNGATLRPNTGLAAVSTSKNFALLGYFPDFTAALAGFPRAERPGVAHGHYWIKREIGGRPNYILVHQVVAGGADHAIFAMREYYVGHTYEALQFVMLALPAEGGSLLVLVTSTFADRATGFFNDLARWFGQRRMRDDLRNHFEALKAEPAEPWPVAEGR